MRLSTGEVGPDRVSLSIELSDVQRLVLNLSPSGVRPREQNLSIRWQRKPTSRHTYGSEEVQTQHVGYGTLYLPEFTIGP